ncbi:hypothetical protein [Microcoleus sp. B9-D4]
MTKAYLAANQTITKPLPLPVRVRGVGLRQMFFSWKKEICHQHPKHF